jgi:hypothetical protein
MDKTIEKNDLYLKTASYYLYLGSDCSRASLYRLPSPYKLEGPHFDGSALKKYVNCLGQYFI